MRELCEREGLDPDRGEIAGLAHDLYRESSNDEILETARRDELPFEPWEREKPLLLHGRAAAVWLSDRLRIHDQEILEAVRWHTTGRPGMGTLASLLFVADHCEPGRDHVDAELRARIRATDAREGVLIILEETMRHHETVGDGVLEPTLRLYRELGKMEPGK